jgi:hypothetical protein
MMSEENHTKIQSKKELPKYKGDTDTYTTAKLPGGFDLFKPSSFAVRNNLPAFLWLAGVPLLVGLISNLGTRSWIGYGSANSPNLGLVYTLGLAGLIVAALLGPGVVVLQLKSVRGENIDAASAFKQGLHYFWRFIGLWIVLGFALFISLLLFIVPFFILLPRVLLAQYYLIDRDLGIMDAIRMSAATYKKYKQLWGVVGVSVLIALVNIIPILGAIVSIVLEFLYSPAQAIRYEQYRLLDENKLPKTPIEIKVAEAS